METPALDIKLHNLLVPVEGDRLPAMVTFYRDGLGMALRAQGPSWAWLQAGAVKLVLHTVSDERPEFRHTGHGLCLEFRVSNLEAACAQAAGAGGRRVSAWREGALSYAGLCDPMGNMIEVFEETAKGP